jgi:hypothetical protein
MVGVGGKFIRAKMDENRWEKPRFQSEFVVLLSLASAKKWDMELSSCLKFVSYIFNAAKYNLYLFLT